MRAARAIGSARTLALRAVAARDAPLRAVGPSCGGALHAASTPPRPRPRSASDRLRSRPGARRRGAAAGRSATRSGGCRSGRAAGRGRRRCGSGRCRRRSRRRWRRDGRRTRRAPSPARPRSSRRRSPRRSIARAPPPRCPPAAARRRQPWSTRRRPSSTQLASGQSLSARVVPWTRTTVRSRSGAADGARAQAERRRRVGARAERGSDQLARAVERVAVLLDPDRMRHEPARRPLVAAAVGPVRQSLARRRARARRSAPTSSGPADR